MNESMTIAKRTPSLIPHAEIERLVRHFAAHVLSLRAAWHCGDEGAQDPLQAFEREARAASAAAALTPHGRALCMYLLPDEVKAFGDPGVGLFMWIASQTVQMMQAIEGGESEDAIKSKIEAMLTDVVDRLTGQKY
ncbi:hypothetical protein P3T18_004459 [Paraburkholderia sp. GAS199]|uniref:hypothetical protein n=1 Tax=Paraburkholderia sp. GAS199 TaxID=3035126 RepID=UPI003D1F5808